MTASRTLNQLHFEDLEPHRFEDLVRQLTYDFREWSNLEATGRTGSDDGFDVRGRERATILLPSDDSDDDENERTTEERIWLVQCKREKAIPPAKLQKYVEEVLADQQEQIYGIIFAAPCDFSKRSRDRFLSIIRSHGVQEFQLWGRGELEDLLFQPKNDHLLFAYFSISLQVRKRSLKTSIRSWLSTKRQALMHLQANDHRGVLIRDPREDRYPNDDDISEFNANPAWGLYKYKGPYFDGLVFAWSKYFAYLDSDRKHFDYIASHNDAKLVRDWSQANATRAARGELHDLWLEVPEENRAWLEVDVLLPFRSILAIDDQGDEIYECPHLYVERTAANSFFDPSNFVTLYTAGRVERVEIYPEIDDRCSYFPKHLREKSGK